MATYTSNYAWTKPEGSDPVDIGVLNNNLDSQDSIVHNAYMQLAPVFSTASTYAVDDVVLYANNLYKCITAVTVAGDWDATKWTQVKVSDIAGGGGGGTSDYTDLTNKPQINGVTLNGNKSTSYLGITAAEVGLGNVPNVATDDQTPTFTTASSRNNLVSGEKLSIMLGKISKFFNDLKTVAFTGSYADLTNTPSIPAAQVNSDWSASSGVAEILNKPTLATVATSGSYNDLTNKPTIPSQAQDISYGSGTVKDALDRQDKHTYAGSGSLVTITSYTDANNPYIAPSDGYVRVTSGSIRLGTTSANIALMSSSATASVFVRKSTPLYIVTSADSTTSAFFISLS